MMRMSMDVMPGDIEPEIPISPPLSHPDRPEPQNKALHATEECAQPPIWDIPDDSAESNYSTSAGPASVEPETMRDNDDACARMIEKWHSIKRADRNRAEKKIYRTDGVYKQMFGKDYSEFYDAFQQGIRNSEAAQIVATRVPAKRLLTAPSEQASKRRRQDDPDSLPQMDQHEATRISAQPSTVTTTRATTGAELSEITSPPSEVEESSVRPTPKSDSAAKDQPSRRKGVGLYAGNWEYATDEEKIPEYLSVAEKIADVEGRTTRRAYAKLTSNECPSDTSKLSRSSLDNQVRKSGRARNTVDYARLSTTKDNNHEGRTRELSPQSDLSATQEAKQTSPSTPASSTSNRSTLMLNDHSRSTSKTTAPNTEQLVRPKASWNAIVYEILALAEAPLTFPELMQDIRNRYPYFKSFLQEKVLKSGLKNPLYFHEAFIKGDVIDGKQTWGLKPGEFLDKKTGEVLTPQPRNPIRSSRSSEQVHKESATPLALTPKVTHYHRPHSSNPRFGREILNSPEIPDSQDAIPTASSPVGAANHSVAEHVLRFREFTVTPKPADGENRCLPTASPEVNASAQRPQSHSHWPTTVGSPVKPTSTGRHSMAAVSEDKDIRKFIGPIDREASAKAAQTRAASSPSSVGRDEHHHSPAATFQVASTPIPPVHTVSSKYLSALNPGGAARSQTPEEIPATLTPSVISLPETQLIGSPSPDGKAGAKESTFLHMPRWA